MPSGPDRDERSAAAHEFDTRDGSHSQEALLQIGQSLSSFNMSEHLSKAHRSSTADEITRICGECGNQVTRLVTFREVENPRSRKPGLLRILSLGSQLI